MRVLAAVRGAPPGANRRRTHTRSLAAGRALAIVIALGASPARGDALVFADPWEIIHIARELGPAEVGRDSMRDPEIAGSTDGLDYRVAFYGCRLGRDCDTILFEARLARKEWQEKPLDPEIFARWNSEKLIGRAWLDEQGRAVLDWPVTLAAGVPKDTLRAAFARWRAALAEFADQVDFR